MKKGITGSIIGFVVFFLVFNFIFAAGNSIWTAVPSIFFIILIGGIFSFIKKAGNTINDKIQDTESTDYGMQEESQFDNSEKNKYDINSEYKSSSYNQTNKDTYQSQRPSYSKRCKECNALIEYDDKYCPECGASQKNTIICEYCGHENPASNALCEKCNGFL